MTDRDEQERAKQGILLELNERVLEAAREFGSADDERDFWDFACECGARGCRAFVSLTLAEYQTLRKEGRSLLAAGHEVHGAAALQQTPAERKRRRA